MDLLGAFLFTLLLLSLLQGCEIPNDEDDDMLTPKCKVQCAAVAAPVSFSDDFFLAQLNNVEVRKYPPGCFWDIDSLLSLEVYTLSDNTRYFFNDSTSALGFTGLELTADYDYTINFAATSGTVWISNVEETRATEEVDRKKLPYECFRPIHDMTLTEFAYSEKISAEHLHQWHVRLSPW